MQFSVLINGVIMYTREVTPKKRRCDIYDFYEYVVDSTIEFMRRGWFYRNGIDTHSDLTPWVAAFNTYLNNARKEKELHSLKMKFRINGQVYTIQIIQKERLNLIH